MNQLFYTNKISIRLLYWRHIVFNVAIQIEWFFSIYVLQVTHFRETKWCTSIMKQQSWTFQNFCRSPSILICICLEVWLFHPISANCFDIMFQTSNTNTLKLLGLQLIVAVITGMHFEFSTGMAGIWDQDIWIEFVY